MYHQNETILAWVETNGKNKEIVWKRWDPSTNADFEKYYDEHEQKEEGIVSMQPDLKSNELIISKHNPCIELPKQALAIGYFTTTYLKSY